MADPALSPHHFAEALIQSLLTSRSLADLPAYDLKAPNDPTCLGALLGLPCGQPFPIAANVALQTTSTSPTFDGKHEIDCAVFLEDSVLPIELKLGLTRLSPREFFDRFVSKAPRLTHGGTRIAGSMVALLDWNGRTGPSEQPFLSLRARGCDVQQR